MARHTTFALGFAAAASLLLGAATGCGTSNNPAGGPDAGQNGSDSGATLDAGSTPDAGDSGGQPCNDGCLCFGADACPGGCYVSQTVQPDGSASERFCGNGIVECAPGGGAWSIGDMSNSCPVPQYPPVYAEGGPAGALCCVVDVMDAEGEVPDGSVGDGGGALDGGAD